MTLAKDHPDFKVKTCFSLKKLGDLEPGRIGMKIYTNDLGHMTNMAAMPIYGKNLKKSFSPEPID